MKKFFLTLIIAALACGSASARRLQAGLRGGVTATDYRFSPVVIDGTRFTAGSTRAGFETGFVLRLNLSKHLHLQSELDYGFINYSVHAANTNLRTNVRLRSERLEVPVQLGLQFGALRLFGGASFRLHTSLHSSHTDLLKVKFSEKPAWLGGVGLNIGKFFFDARVQGPCVSKNRDTFISRGVARQVRVRNDLVWSGSIGFFF
ncbi:MAG: PorT family protein [Alistipes senegalensis]|nr:PorT family protein [Bacteroides cellulosilyticus]MCM1352505.1 PorT family protein [Alistipes senegalensis]